MSIKMEITNTLLFKIRTQAQALINEQLNAEDQVAAAWTLAVASVLKLDLELPQASLPIEPLE